MKRIKIVFIVVFCFALNGCGKNDTISIDNFSIHRSIIPDDQLIHFTVKKVLLFNVCSD